LNRFLEDFLFQLTPEEAVALSGSLCVTLKRGQNIKYSPFAFSWVTLPLPLLLMKPITGRIHIREYAYAAATVGHNGVKKGSSMSSPENVHFGQNSVSYRPRIC